MVRGVHGPRPWLLGFELKPPLTLLANEVYADRRAKAR